MGKNAHQDYLYMIKKDLTWTEVNEKESHIFDDNFLCFVKIVFVKNNGEYTYSNHFIFDQNMSRTPLLFGKIKSADFFKEFLAIFHCASIAVDISDTLGQSKRFILHHQNGLGSKYTDIDGHGIYSIIDALKIMKELDELKTWETFDLVLSVKEKIVDNMRKADMSYSNIKSLVELSDFHISQIYKL